MKKTELRKRRAFPSAIAPVGAVFKEAIASTRSAYYLGTKFKCPICRWHFRRLLTFAGRRHNAICPKCYSLERHRLLWAYIEGATDLLEGSKRLLHFAPENCLEKRFKEVRHLEYMTADLHRPNVMWRMNIERIPFGDNSFDAVIANHVLEHVENDLQAMNEILRVLKPSGWAILQVPLDVHRSETFEDQRIVDEQDRTRYFGQHDHVRLYGVDYPDRLRSAGFVVDVVHQQDFLGQRLIDRYALYTGEPIFKGVKS